VAVVVERRADSAGKESQKVTGGRGPVERVAIGPEEAGGKGPRGRFIP